MRVIFWVFIELFFKYMFLGERLSVYRLGIYSSIFCIMLGYILKVRVDGRCFSRK